MLKQLLVVLVTLGIVGSTSVTNWKPCPGGSKTLDFTINSCAGKRVCIVKRGEVRSLGMKFRANADSTGLTAVVLGKSRGMSSPMPLASNTFNSNACDFLLEGASCPIVRDTLYRYRMPLLIEQFFPPSTYLIQFSLKDSKSRTQACGRTVIRVV